MSDVMNVQPFDLLLKWMLRELEENQSLFGIHRSLFYHPRRDSLYSTNIFGHYLATPIGPGAGPHTQLAQNIVCAWLSGGRFIELKTVQIMDELEIPRPCIDMADEGYNVEWSQELKLAESAEEYVKAWALIHVLRRLLGLEDRVPFGTVFNMSVGYDLDGIKSPAMLRFMDRLEDASEEIAKIQTLLSEKFPQFADLEIPERITDNVTLSTMHGCPPDEIEGISRYLMEERGLHTFIKLNPTLLGKDEAMRILHDRLGFTEIHVPDHLFEQDLQYDQAVELIKRLKQVSEELGLTLGIKLSNTLPMANHKGYLPGEELFMSGRALYPLTMNLFHKLFQQFAGNLNVSYCAGVDALNLTGILAAGACPVTAVTDLLKPGGYSRMLQYLENLEREMRELKVTSLEELAREKLTNLEREAARALEDPRYKKGYHPYGLPKVESKLELFDCVAAPCVKQCAVLQDVPEYAWLISQGEYDRALEVTLSRNPLPGVTGYVCNHLCQARCTRNDYEEPVAIRALKRFAAERGRFTPKRAAKTGHRVAVVGSGPSGLAAAYFLALNSIEVTIYEAKDGPGGMLSLAPEFRLPREIIGEAIDRITDLGVEIVLSHPVTEPPESLLEEGFDAVYLAWGAQQDARLGMEGEGSEGVYHALDLLQRVGRGEELYLGGRVLVIGGGNTAMDAARTAKRLTGGSVTVLYRRTRREMPATEEEIEELLKEGIALEELVSPERIISRDGRAVGLGCVRNELGQPGPDGRRKPVPIEGREFRIEADSVIVAIGQRPDVSFLDGSTVSLREDGTINVDSQTGQAADGPVYAGGDAVRGPATIIEACADGRRAAQAICRRLDVPFERPAARLPALSEEEVLQVKGVRARKIPQHKAKKLPPEKRGGFDLVESTLGQEEARAEAARCVQCSTFCDKCVEVCPNRANYTFLVSPVSLTLPKLSFRQGELELTGEEVFRIGQARQIIHVDDFCNECGNCATFCVHHGRPYLDKPRLFLKERDFQREDDAFFVERSERGWTIRRRQGGRESRLSGEESTGELEFENDQLMINLSPSFEIGSLELREEFEGEFSLNGAAEMAIILKGLTDSLPFLPFPEEGG